MSGSRGHGHVNPRPDGVRARCGGPGICAECSHEQALAIKGDADIKALREENERLKERLEKSESRRTHWDAVTLTNYEFTKTQLAEAGAQLEAAKKVIEEYKDMALGRDKNGKLRMVARAFLEKVKG